MARASWEDTKKGKRPSEIEFLEAQLRQAKVALAFSEKDLARQERLFQTSATSTDDLDRARHGEGEAAHAGIRREARPACHAIG